MKISLFIPCYIDSLYPAVGISVVRIFEKLGIKVEFNESLICCGQPAFNAGFWADTRHIAERVIQRLQKADAVVIPSGSCAAMLRNFYPELFHNQRLETEALELARKTYEFSEFLVDQLGVFDLGSQFYATVTFHDGCHGQRELQVLDQPRQLLNRVKGLTLIEMEDRQTCCGFGGLFAVKFPMISTAMGEIKYRYALNTGAEYLVSNDSSCLMHLQGLLNKQKQRLKTLHLAEVLACF